ncbi:MAG TPA: hypothetical protein VEC12_02630 [Bacteroidia bacterium]|nr:hypothetical protein [Bacteroidia bacterium]
MMYEETQGYKKLLWLLIPMPITLVMIFTFWLAEKDPAEKTEILYGLLMVVGVELLVLLLFLNMKLVTRINREGITYHYRPFLKARYYSWNDIKTAAVRKYNPIGEYGGWGLKAGWKKNNKAYNVWGNKGLQLELKDGNKVLIGTQQHQDMVSFLRRLKEKYNIVPIEEPKLNG